MIYTYCTADSVQNGRAEERASADVEVRTRPVSSSPYVHVVRTLGFSFFFFIQSKASAAFKNSLDFFCAMLRDVGMGFVERAESSESKWEYMVAALADYVASHPKEARDLGVSNSLMHTFRGSFRPHTSIMIIVAFSVGVSVCVCVCVCVCV